MTITEKQISELADAMEQITVIESMWQAKQRDKVRQLFKIFCFRKKN